MNGDIILSVELVRCLVWIERTTIVERPDGTQETTVDTCQPEDAPAEIDHAVRKIIQEGIL